MAKNIFQDILKGKIVFVGIGNTLRSDDGLGPAIIERLKNHTAAVCIDAGSAPENHSGKIIKEKPDTVILIDAAHLGLETGQYRILKNEEIANSGFTTHNISPKLFIEYLQSRIKADIYLLAIQPENISFGEELSEPVKKAVGEVSRLIIEATKEKPKTYHQDTKAQKH
jgi:hydrogenase 3 maturation protease